MADENKKFPNGWGSDEDDDYGFIDDTDEDDEDSAWGSGSPFKKKESVTDSNENEGSDNVQTESSVPAQEVKTSENSAAPVPPVNPPYNQGYVIQKQKSNPLFIIVIIILVLIIGVLCAAIFVVNKNKKTNDSEKSDVNSVDEISETISKNTENDNTETETPDITTAAKTEINNESTTNIADLNIDTSEAVKKTLYAHLEEEFNNEKKDTYYYFDRDAKYALYDINADGIDELFISYHNMISTGSDLYIYKNGEYIKSHCFTEGAKICISEHLLMEKVYGGGEMTKIYVISDNEILQKDELDELYGNKSFHHNDYVIDESKYKKLKSEYDSLDWINIPDNSYSFSDLIDMSAYEKKEIAAVDVYSCNYLGVINTHGLGVAGFATSYVVGGGEVQEVRHRLGDWHVKAVRYCTSKDILWYELYDSEDGDYYGWVDAEYIDFSPSDTSEYTDKSNLIATGKVITEKDDLNMRESDSATSKIVTTIPKGNYVGIISEYGDWLYVKYYADTNSPIYYGFVSKQFIEITERYGNG